MAGSLLAAGGPAPSATIPQDKPGREQLLSPKELAQLLGVRVVTLWRLRRAGKVPVRPIRLSASTIRFKASEIYSWIARGCPESGEGGGHE